MGGEKNHKIQNCPSLTLWESPYFSPTKEILTRWTMSEAAKWHQNAVNCSLLWNIQNTTPVAYQDTQDCQFLEVCGLNAAVLWALISRIRIVSIIS